MPVLTSSDQMGLHISTLKKVNVQTYGATPARYPFPIDSLIKQVVSDRLAMAGDRLGDGDQLVLRQNFRSAISRHYYAMYHAARAVVFAVEKGDDYEGHSVLPRQLPSAMPDVAQREVELTDARLLRNRADYDIYPVGESGWEADSRALAVTATLFVSSFENFALMNGYV